MAMVLPATIPRGQTLRDYRERACPTQSELAAMARCSRFSVTKIELGQVAPSMRVRRQIAAALGVGPDKVAWPRRIARVADAGSATEPATSEPAPRSDRPL